MIEYLVIVIQDIGEIRVVFYHAGMQLRKSQVQAVPFFFFLKILINRMCLLRGLPGNPGGLKGTSNAPVSTTETDGNTNENC